MMSMLLFDVLLCCPPTTHLSSVLASMPATTELQVQMVHTTNVTQPKGPLYNYPTLS